jgi:hypothetical protein
MDELPTIHEILTQVATAKITRGEAHLLILKRIGLAVAEAATRDQFAMHAMSSLMLTYEGVDVRDEDIAGSAYMMADAMIAARGSK